MGLFAFCGFVLPWVALALWLFLTQIKPGHTGVPWRPLTDYVAPGDGRRSAGAMEPGSVTPTASPATPTGREGAGLH